MSEHYPQRGDSLDTLIQMIRQRRLSPRALAEQAIEAHRPALRAYAHWRPEKLRAQALVLGRKGRLQGIPVSVKDNIAVAGWPLEAGSGRALPAHLCQEGSVVAMLRRQGVVFSGKTQTVAFAFSSLGTSPQGEGPRNPWDLQRVCGGSSSGAAVSVIEGSARLALGTDTAGSVRVPAAMTGCVGLKTTVGRWPRAGVIPLSHSLDSLGLLAPRAADIVTGLAAFDPAPALKRIEAADLRELRIGLPKALLEATPTDPGIAESFHAALSELEARGARLVEVESQLLLEARALFREGGVVASELHQFLFTQMPTWLEGQDKELNLAMRSAANLPASAYLERLQTMTRLCRQADLALREIDVLVTPTTPLTPPTFASLTQPSVYIQGNARILDFTAFVNYLRLCAVSLPIGQDAAGMPTGLQLVASGFAEARLLAIALTVERALGEVHQRLGPLPFSDNNIQ
ncbi:amidase [Pistricoccus aurantiacus]|uniref:Amidase n=1 Tax=Pistricoccus aurantiacus TaxID=1883414 RepID=A0A5B8SP04_9GAMM|nr:amidase [Pistricoccus aurantiacus]QEA38446.1 amidase [Pistricoccus aurantiacus]